MAISDTEYTAWLKSNSARRCILVETSYGESQGGALITDAGDLLVDDMGDSLVVPSSGTMDTDVYLSNVGYSTEITDTLSSVIYLPHITGGIRFTESLDLEKKASLSFGDLEINNTNGQYDEWLNYIWTNRDITVLFGDVVWDRGDFRTVFSGVIDGIDSKNRNSLSIKVLDKLQRLNTPMSDDVLGGATVNKDKLLPIAHGECFNVTPMLIDDALLKYQVHSGAIEGIIEVRDNGVPVLTTNDLPSGTFTLNTNPYGTITCSVQGDKLDATYKNTVADCVQNIAINYGDVNKQFTLADIDAANFATFDINNPQPVGLYANARINCLNAINQFADSVGAQAVMSRGGLLRLLKIELPPTSTAIEINPVNMVERSLKIAKRLSVRSAIKIGFCKNYTAQRDLSTGIPEEHKLLYADEWVYKTRSDASVAADYLLDVEPVQKDTLLLNDTDADEEASRLLDIFLEQRTVFEFDGYADLIELELGDAVILTHNRFGLSGGKTGMVIKMQIDWLKMRVKVGVII